MSYVVVFAPEAEDQLADLYLFIATEASSANAQRYRGDRVVLRAPGDLPASRNSAS